MLWFSTFSGWFTPSSPPSGKTVPFLFLVVVFALHTTTTTAAVQNSLVEDSTSSTLPRSSTVEEHAALVEEESPFSIVIDGGSTGSRLHVFEFVTKDASDDENDDGATTVTNCVRRGSARANVPLSAFAPSLLDDGDLEPLSPRHVAEHLLPAFEYAATVIPPKYYNTTLVTYQATAGMRLLTDEQQEAVYDALYEGLRTAPEFVFYGLQRSDIQTLSGELEGFYGAVAANYLKGTITADLELLSNSKVDNHDDDDCGGPLGALDMGGSSTQIVFLPSVTAATATTTTNQPSNDSDDFDNNERNEPGYCLSHYTDKDDDDESDTSSSSNSSSKHACHVATAEELSPRVLKGEDFFATSYLSYGVDQFRERLWNTWVQEARAKQVEVERAQRETETIDDSKYHDAGRTCSQDEGTCNSNLILNPCAFRGYIMEWDGFQFIGTGQAEECVRHVQRLIPHPELPWDSTLPEDDLLENPRLGQHVGGKAHPPVRGKFLAMSLYFFTLDSLRELTRNNTAAYHELNRSWPTPSIQELHNALEGLCARGWADDLELIQHSAHAFTRPEVLPHRCLESVYLVTLLKDGFGFAPESRDITFTFLVDGSEVEWSLGMALALRAQQRVERQQPASAFSPFSAAELFGDDLGDFSATMFNESSDAGEQQADTTADNYADDSTSSLSNLLYRMVDQLIAIKLSFPLDDLV